MNREPRQERTDHVLDRTNKALPQIDPDVQRAIDAVRESTPRAVVTMLEARGLFDSMLAKMQHRFGGRPLNGIHREELVQIARDSVDETLGIEPLSRSPRGFPEPEVDDPDEALMGEVDAVVQAWRAGELSTADAATRARELLRKIDYFTP